MANSKSFSRIQQASAMRATAQVWPKFGVLAMVFLCGMMAFPSSAVAQPPIMEVTLGGRVEKGLPVFWGASEALLLRRDGSLLKLKTAEIEKKKISKELFRSLDTVQSVASLQAEFANGLEVETNGRYIIVSPPGRGRDWLNRFEGLSVAFQNYFSTRGLPLRNPEFPLVAIVLPNQASFLAYAGRDQLAIDSSVLGYYSIYTNRMILFDLPSAAGGWFSTDTTILHEATHQLAFNMGVHQRLSDAPLWVVEGLASVFEVPGQVERRSSHDAMARVHPARLRTWKSLAQSPQGAAAILDQLVGDDRLFDAMPDQAYAVAWAASFYLSERETSRYTRYLEMISQLRPNETYSVGQRRKDFKQMIGGDLLLLCRNIDRFLDGESNSDGE